MLPAAQQGAGWALGHLWEELSPAVVGYLRGQGAKDPEDLTSEVFIGAFRNLGSFEGDEQALRRWLFTIAHRRLTDERRRRGRQPRHVELDPEVHVHAAPDASSAVVAAAGLGELQAVLDTLKPAQRDVMLLRVVAGLSADETGEVLGRTANNVRVLQHRAIGVLRKKLGASEKILTEL